MGYLVGGRVMFNRHMRTGSSWTLAAMEASGIKVVLNHPEWRKRLGRGPLIHGASRWPVSFFFRRDPFEWYRSYHAWLGDKLKRRGRVGWSLKGPLSQFWVPDLNVWVRRVCEASAGSPLWSLSGSFQEFSRVRAGDVCYIGRQEFLADDLVAILGWVGVDFDEGLLRGTCRVKRSPGKQVLDGLSVGLIESMESWVLKEYSGDRGVITVWG